MLNPLPHLTMLSYDEKSARIDTGTPTAKKQSQHCRWGAGVRLRDFLSKFAKIIDVAKYFVQGCVK